MAHFFVLVAAVMGSFIGCHPRPIAELALADVAMKAAHRAKADSLAPDTFRKAENYYLRAKKDFADGYFQACRKNSDEARRLAEQAEYQSLKRHNQIRGAGGFDFDPTPAFDNPPPEQY